MSDDLSVRLAKLNIGLEKAGSKSGKRRIPGDGDGDGIPNEGKKPGAGTGAVGTKAKASLKQAGFKDFGDGFQRIITGGAANAGFEVKNGLTRAGWRVRSASYDAAKGLNRYSMHHSDGSKIAMTIENRDVKNPRGQRIPISTIRVKPSNE
jgi:hypothetical protein